MSYKIILHEDILFSSRKIIIYVIYDGIIWKKLQIYPELNDYRSIPVIWSRFRCIPVIYVDFG